MSRLGLALMPVVLGNDVQRQQVLPLVFVNALDQNDRTESQGLMSTPYLAWI